MSDHTIRPATAADAEAIAALYAHHVLHGFGTFEEVPPSQADMIERMNDVAARGLPWRVAVSPDGAVLGYAYAGAFRTRAAYDYDPEAGRIGLQAAQALGVDPDAVLKTLMTQVDGKPVCVVLPSDREVSMKALARLFDAKSARMMAPPDAERLTGYVIGGVSPFGQKRHVPTVVEETALLRPLVFINAGQRGLQVRLDPEDAVAVLRARVAAIAV